MARRFAALFVLLPSLGSLLVACAPALGPVFQQPRVAAPHEAVVYLYRPSRFAGSAVSYDVRLNGAPVTRLYSGGYFPIVTRPGVLELSASTESSAVVRVQAPPGQVQYLRGTVKMGFLVGRPHLEQVSAAEAFPEITQCGLLPPVAGHAVPLPDVPPPPPAQPALPALPPPPAPPAS